LKAASGTLWSGIGSITKKNSGYMPREWVKKVREKYFPAGSFRFNILTLASGTMVSQALLILILPLLVRLYTPSDFGEYALYVSIVSIIAAVASMRYDVAIILPASDEEAVNLLALAVVIAFGVSLAAGISVWKLNLTFANFLGHSEKLRWFYAVPITIFLTSCCSGIWSWLNREKQYGIISKTKLYNSGIISVLQLIFGLCKAGVTGLIIGYVTGWLVTTLILANEFCKRYFRQIKAIELAKLKQAFFCYQNFPRFDVPTTFLYTLTNQLPFILLNKFFGDMVAGFYALTHRVLGAPGALIGMAVWQVFRERAKSDFSLYGNCQEIFLKTSKTLFLISLMPFLCLFLFSPQLFSLVFGYGWRSAGFYAQIMSVAFFLGFITVPLSYTLYIRSKQHYELMWNFFMFLLVAGAIYVGKHFANPTLSILCLAITNALMYIIRYALSYKCSTR